MEPDECYLGSALFPELDLDLLSTFLDHPTLTQAVRAYREALGR